MDAAIAIRLQPRAKRDEVVGQRADTIVVRVTAPNSVGSSTTLTVGKRKKDPKIKRSKVNP